MPAKPTPIIPAEEVEVLPREDPTRRGSPGQFNDALPRLIALFLDNLIKVPGVKRRVGLDAIFDFLPGVGEFGDAAATLISSLTILEGARRGLPKIVLARMAGNVLLNGLIGVIPFVGGAFAFWFRPSQRNYQLLLRHTSGTTATVRRSTARDWVFVLALVGGMLVIALTFIGLGLWVSLHLLKALFGVQ